MTGKIELVQAVKNVGPFITVDDCKTAKKSTDVRVCVCVCVCVCVYTITENNRSSNLKLEYVVVYENRLTCHIYNSL